MTKMAVMPIYGQNFEKTLLLGTRSPIILKLGMDFRGLIVYNSYIKVDPWLTLPFSLIVLTSGPQVSIYRTIDPLVYCK